MKAEKLHILTVIGARPQIIKAAALSRAIQSRFSDQIRETIVHTGQHYDDNMSQVFFDELGIPSPQYNLHIGSGKHGQQTAAMIVALENVLLESTPDAVVLYGDTNSTLAGSIAASKLNIPVIHIEAGLRSFNRTMPEEINRILCDHVSTLLFSPTKTGYENLIREGIVKTETTEKASAVHPVAYHCGDIMYDNSRWFSSIAAEKSSILTEQKLTANNYLLATIHRDSNTDDPEKLGSILESLLELAERFTMPVVLPLHPRTRKQFATLSTTLQEKIQSDFFLLLPPASFLDMIQLEKNARLILTDSGGVQKEAFFFEKPCVILRNETEWVELVACGAAQLAGSDRAKITAAANSLMQDAGTFPPLFGDGDAAGFICTELVRHLA
jgi:UDP-GlcNAc3NAcA epimerase